MLNPAGELVVSTSLTLAGNLVDAILKPRDLATIGDGMRLKKGDLLRIVTPDGGWGCPLDRPAEDVLGAVLDGFVSVESAGDDYGMIVAAAGASVDEAATCARRAAMPRSAAIFHRGRYYDAEEDLQDDARS